MIELMVVISVISFLTAGALLMFNTARIKGRDAKRLADLKQMQTSLELYYDRYDQYPTYVDSNPADNGWDHSDIGDGFVKGLEDNIRGDNPDNVRFIKVPVDPKNLSDSCHCCGINNDLVYTYVNTADDRKRYKLCVAFENARPGGLTFECANGSYPVYCIVKN